MQLIDEEMTPRPGRDNGGLAAGPSEAEVAEADRVLAAMLPDLTAGKMAAQLMVALATAAGMTAAGAGLVLFGPVGASACAIVAAGRLSLFAVAQRQTARQAAGKPRKARKPGKAGKAVDGAEAGEQRPVMGLAEAVAVHAASLPGRVPAETLAAAGRHLPAIAAARGRERAWLYVAPCPGPDAPVCSGFCCTAATWKPGGLVMVILGEHPAGLPQAAASALSHEAAHYEYRWLFGVHYARSVIGWGWAAAGLAGALAGGWPGAAVAGAVFWVVSLAALWAGETLCDLRSVRTEGYPATVAGFGYMADLLADRLPVMLARPRTRRRWVRRAKVAGMKFLDGVAGPAHPPLPLRRALARLLARRARPLPPTGSGR